MTRFQFCFTKTLLIQSKSTYQLPNYKILSSGSSCHGAGVNKSDWEPWGWGFGLWPCSVCWGSGVAVSCGVGRRCSSDPMLLCLWLRLAAAALIRPLAWEPPYAAGAKGQKTKKKKNFFFLTMATPSAYGSSQAIGQIGTTNAGLCHRHKARSLTYWARPGIEPMSSRTLPLVLNPLSYNGNSLTHFIYLFVYLFICVFALSVKWLDVGSQFPDQGLNLGCSSESAES